MCVRRRLVGNFRTPERSYLLSGSFLSTSVERAYSSHDSSWEITLQGHGLLDRMFKYPLWVLQNSISYPIFIRTLNENVSGDFIFQLLELTIPMDTRNDDA